MDDSVALTLVTGGAAGADAARLGFPETDLIALTRAEARPRAPFAGRLFEVLGRQTAGDCLGLVVPAVWRGASGGAGADGAAAPQRPADPPPEALLAVADHVNLELRGPLTGRWPAAVPRTFPSLSGIYQPAIVRSRVGARLYSSGVVVAGVSDARALTPFEARAAAEGGLSVFTDTLVPIAIVAAYHGLKLAACVIVQAPAADRE